jgi:hypothetical protein
MGIPSQPLIAPWIGPRRGAVVADQDRREGRQPRTLRDVPDGRGRGIATDVRRHLVVDRPAGSATRSGEKGA